MQVDRKYSLRDDFRAVRLHLHQHRGFSEVVICVGWWMPSTCPMMFARNNSDPQDIVLYCKNATVDVFRVDAIVKLIVGERAINLDRIRQV